MDERHVFFMLWVPAEIEVFKTGMFQWFGEDWCDHRCIVYPLCIDVVLDAYYTTGFCSWKTKVWM